MGPPGDGTRDGWVVYNDKLYINLNSEIKKSFLSNLDGNVQLGDEQWTSFWGGLKAGPFYPTCFSSQGGRCNDPGGDMGAGDVGHEEPRYDTPPPPPDDPFDPLDPYIDGGKPLDSDPKEQHDPTRPTHNQDKKSQ